MRLIDTTLMFLSQLFAGFFFLIQALIIIIIYYPEGSCREIKRVLKRIGICTMASPVEPL